MWRHPRFVRVGPAGTIPIVLILVGANLSHGGLAESDRLRLESASRSFHSRLAALRNQRFRELRESTTGPQASLNAHPGLELQYLDERGRPMFYIAHNRIAAQTVGTDGLWPGGWAGLSLTGSGTLASQLGVWDFGAARVTHQELTGRVTWADTAAYVTSGHSTHVAGTMVAAGVDGNARGMSYQAGLASYEWNFDLSEMAQAAANGMTVSNHSYGLAGGWLYDPGSGTWYWFGDRTLSNTEDYIFGFYNQGAADFDQIASDAPDYCIVVSAGNEHLQGPAPGTSHYHWDFVNGQWAAAADTHDVDGGADGFDCIPPMGTAKNVITVGAVGDDPGNGYPPGITGFSGRGPTDDGRVKPDLVANGDGLYSTLDNADDAYGVASGTSMSTPNLSGSLNLLVRHHESTHGGATPSSAAMKAVLCHSAWDLGNEGPDYTHGWGLLQVGGAYLVMRDDSLGHRRIVEGALKNGETHAYYLHRTNSDPLRVTLAWTDPPAAAPSPALNGATSMLVNDLDVRVDQEDGDPTSFLPWVLDPANPGSPATRGDNARDNVEQVAAAFPNGSYFKITVSHKGTLAGPQAYALVGSDAIAPWQSWTAAGSSVLASTSSFHLAWSDHDSDGDQDLSVGGKLLQNDGSGSFTDVTSAPLSGAGVGPRTWGDYDNDGDPDVYVVPNQLFRNDGGGSFALETNNPPVLPPFGPGISSASWSDYDGDGDLDLFLATAGANSLFRNDGASGFVDATPTPFLSDYPWSTGGAWGDYDNDGDPDLYYYAYAAANKLYRNDGGGTFTDVTAGLPLAFGAFDAAWGDYDNDGDLDLALARGYYPPNKLLRNDGGTFVDVTPPAIAVAGIEVGSVDWGDADNDGLLDLFLCGFNGSSRLVKNVGGGSFMDATTVPLLPVGDRAAWADADADGDLDLCKVGNSGSTLMINGLASSNAWLEVRLTGAGPTGLAAGSAGASDFSTQSSSGANLSAVGARVRVVAGGIARIREVSAGGRGQGPMTLHFGLGAATVVDTIEIRWPGSGRIDRMAGFAVDQRLHFTEGTIPAAVSDEVAAAVGVRLAPAAPNPFLDLTTIQYRLAEPARVRVRVFDIGGRVVRTLLDQDEAPGERRVAWDGRDRLGDRAAPGVYLCLFEAGDFRQALRVALAR
jgi:hypothetical protein